MEFLPFWPERLAACSGLASRKCAECAADLPKAIIWAHLPSAWVSDLACNKGP